MKKLFLALLCAGLFFACGNKKDQANTLKDSTDVANIEAPVDSSVCDQAEPACEQQGAVAENNTPSKKTTTTPKKNTNNGGMTEAKKTETSSVEDHAKAAAGRVANKAIDKAETEATNTIVNSGKKKR